MKRLSLLIIAIIVMAVAANARPFTGYEVSPERTLTYYDLPANVQTYLETNLSEFSGVFTIKTFWDPADYASQDDWPFPPDSIYAFAELVMPPRGTHDLDWCYENSIMEQVTTYYGADGLPNSYEDVRLTPCLTTYDEFYIYLDVPGYSRYQPCSNFVRCAIPGSCNVDGYGNITNLVIYEDDATPHRIATDGFAHEWQHLVFGTMDSNPDHMFTKEIGTNEYFSQCSEYHHGSTWDSPGSVTDVTCYDLPFTRNLLEKDWWDGFIGHDVSLKHGTYAMFAPYLIEHYATSSDWDDELLFNWKTKPDDDVDYEHRHDFWALADELGEQAYQSMFDASGGDERVAEMWQNYVLSLWVNDAGVKGNLSVWADGVWTPRDADGLFTDNDGNCVDDAHAIPFYAVVSETPVTYTDFVYEGDVHTSGPCDNSFTNPKVLMVSSFGMDFQPFVAHQDLQDADRCYNLRIDLDLDDELPALYTCTAIDTCVQFLAEDVLHIDFIGYPSETTELDTHGDEAVLLLSHDVHGGTNALPATLEFSLPCFGSHYKSIVAVMSLSKDSYAEGTTLTSIIPYDFTYWAEPGYKGVLTGSNTWPDPDLITNRTVCVDSTVELAANSSLSIEPGTTVYFAKYDPSPATSVRFEVAGDNAELNIGGGSGAEDRVYLKPCDDSYSWGGFVSTSSSPVYENTRFDIRNTTMENVSVIGIGANADVESIRFDDVSVYFADGSSGFFCAWPDTVEINDVKLFDSSVVYLGANDIMEAERLEINSEETYTGTAATLWSYSALDMTDVLVKNAYNGIEIKGSGTIELGSALGNCSIQVEGRGDSISGTKGIFAQDSADVSIDHCIVKDFEKGIVVEDHADFKLRNSEVMDCIDGVYVPYGKTELDLGVSGDNGNNCIGADAAQGGVRVYNRSTKPFWAVGNYWDTPTPTWALFDGLLVWTPYQTTCSGAGAELVLYLGQASDESSQTAAHPLQLRSVYPNPFNPNVTIEFSLPQSGAAADLSIFDVAGRKVKTLFTGSCNGELLRTQWRGRDARDMDVGSGVYFAVLSADGKQVSHKLVLIR